MRELYGEVSCEGIYLVMGQHVPVIVSESAYPLSTPLLPNPLDLRFESMTNANQITLSGRIGRMKQAFLLLTFASL